MIAQWTSSEWTAFVVQTFAVLTTSALAIIAALRSGAARDAAKDAKTVAESTHVAVNARMEAFLKAQDVRFAELLKTSTDAAHERGVKQAVEIQKSAAPPASASPVEVKVVNPDTEPVPTKPA